MGQIAEATKSCALKQMESIGTKYSLKAKMSDRNMLDGIFYRRVDSLEDLTKVVLESDEICRLIKHNSDIRLIVLDSIAFHFRYSLLSSFDNTSSNIGKLHRISQVLNKIAHQYNIVVIITNQMTSRPRLPGSEHVSSDSSFILTPALGDSWSQSCSTRVMMDFCNKSILEEVVNYDEKARQLMRNIAFKNEPYHRYKYLFMVKSPKHKTPTISAVFRVTSEGIRDA